MPYDQSAYRENHSMETTVCAINNMTEIITNGRCGILVMLDLSAAFDTVEHKLLLEDLRAVAIEKNVYRWYKSYLENRKNYSHYLKYTIRNKKSNQRCTSGQHLGSTTF